MSDNFTELKRLFDAECANHSSSVIFASLLDGLPINQAKRTLIEAVKLIEESCVNAEAIVSAIQLSSSSEER